MSFYYGLSPRVLSMPSTNHCADTLPEFIIRLIIKIQLIKSKIYPAFFLSLSVCLIDFSIAFNPLL